MAATKSQITEIKLEESIMNLAERKKIEARYFGEELECK